MAAHREVRELVEVGAYVAGTNPEVDAAVTHWPGDRTRSCARPSTSTAPAEQSWAHLAALVHALGDLP